MMGGGSGDARANLGELVEGVGACMISNGTWAHSLIDSSRVALPLSIEVRMLKLAALLDLQLAEDLLTSELVRPCAEVVVHALGGGLPLGLVERNLLDSPAVKQITEALRSVTVGG